MKFILPGLLSLGGVLRAQTATLRGVVADQSGAVVPNATVALKGPAGLARTVETAEDGAYAMSGLPPGDYTADATAPRLMLPQPERVSLGTGVQALNLQLKVAATSVQVVVNDEAGPAVSTDPSANAGALVLRGDDLEALSDDPNDLAADLQALAGPSAGLGGGSIFIDGFSSGQLPPKESIREVRINQNPFSPEYDKLGLGRVEILNRRKSRG